MVTGFLALHEKNPDKVPFGNSNPIYILVFFAAELLVECWLVVAIISALRFGV